MDDGWFVNLRWRVCIKLLRWAVMAAPDGSAKLLLHELHMDWCAECRRQWELRYGETTT